MKVKLSGGLITSEEYVCELTEELDRLAGIHQSEDNDWFYHYLYVYKQAITDRNIPIRVPGGTIGGIKLDEDFSITKIVIDTDYVIRTYPADVNEQVKRFIGQKLEFSK